MTQNAFPVVPRRFVEVVLAAKPADVEFRKREGRVHAIDLERGVVQTIHIPVRIGDEVVPDVVKIAYVHDECRGQSEWYVINSMKKSGASPYLSIEVASEEEARSVVLAEIREILLLHKKA